MKTAKSTIKNELVNIEKIRRFTTNELAALSKNPLPFCYQIGVDTLIIGKLKILRINDKCWRVINNGIDVSDFFLRKNAIFYSIAIHRRHNTIATNILKIDTLLGNLEFDATLYRYRYKQAQKQKDLWNIGLFSDRYTETILHINKLKKDLKKLFANAKYINVKE